MNRRNDWASSKYTILPHLFYLSEDGFKSDPLKSRPIKEIDLQKNKKIIKATGEFLIDLVSKVAREVVKGAVQGAIGGGGGALMDETF